MLSTRRFVGLVPSSLLLLLLLLPQATNAGWVSDKLKSARDTALEKTKDMNMPNANEILKDSTAAIDALTGEVVAGLSSAGELLAQKKAEAQEIAAQLSAFAASARKPPSDAVKKMLTEDGFIPDEKFPSCANNVGGTFFTARRCIVWNFAVTLDFGNHSSTDAVGVRVSVKTPGLPAFEKTLMEGEVMVPVPGFAADVKNPLDVSNSLAKLGVFLRFRVANGTDGGLDVNAGVTACASVGLTGSSWAKTGGCLPVEPVVTITNGQIVVAAKIATLMEAGAWEKNLAILTREFGKLDDDGSGAIDAGEFQDIADALKEPLSNTELERVHQDMDKDHSGTVSYAEFLAA